MNSFFVLFLRLVSVTSRKFLNIFSECLMFIILTFETNQQKLYVKITLMFIKYFIVINLIFVSVIKLVEIGMFIW